MAVDISTTELLRPCNGDMGFKSKMCRRALLIYFSN